MIIPFPVVAEIFPADELTVPLTITSPEFLTVALILFLAEISAPMSIAFPESTPPEVKVIAPLFEITDLSMSIKPLPVDIEIFPEVEVTEKFDVSSCAAKFKFKTFISPEFLTVAVTSFAA